MDRLAGIRLCQFYADLLSTLSWLSRRTLTVGISLCCDNVGPTSHMELPYSISNGEINSFGSVTRGMRPIKAFDLNEKYVEEHIVKRCQSFFWVDGVQSMSRSLKAMFPVKSVIHERYQKSPGSQSMVCSALPVELSGLFAAGSLFELSHSYS